MQIIEKQIDELIPYEKNPRNNAEAVKYVKESINEFGFKVPIIIDKNNIIIAGHTRLLGAKELGLETVPCIVADDLSEEQVKAFRLADNKVSEFAEWDMGLLDEELSDILNIDMANFGFEDIDILDDYNPYDIPAEEKGSLNDKFVVPPFSILDTRQGYWNDRKRLWRNKIKDTGETRGEAKDVFSSGVMGLSGMATVSLLDPVLSEVINTWFMPNNGNKCFDVFAGDTVFGYVSSYLGNEFTGIELRKEQADFNNSRVKDLTAKYICDDGRNVLNHIAEESQDLLFSCPPYYDIEVYSDLDNDASNQETYEEFYQILDTAFSNAIKCLKNDRFAVIVAGDIRDKKTGNYYDFCGDIKNTFKKNG